MSSFLRRQLKASVLNGRSERLPLVIVGVGAWVALRLIFGRSNRAVYERALRPGEAVTIRVPAPD